MIANAVAPSGQPHGFADVTVAKRAANLTQHLLAFSRKQVMWPRVISVNSALIEIDKILHRLISENIYLTLLLGTDAGCVKVDPGQPKNLPPLRLDEIENKYRFIRYLEATEKKNILNPGFDSKLGAT